MILKNIFYEFYLLYICVYMKNEYYEKGFYHYMCVFWVVWLATGGPPSLLSLNSWMNWMR